VVPPKYLSYVALSAIAVAQEVLYSGHTHGQLTPAIFGHLGDAAGVPIVALGLIASGACIKRLRHRAWWQLAAVLGGFMAVAFVEISHSWGGPLPHGWPLADKLGTTLVTADIAAAGLNALFCAGVLLALRLAGVRAPAKHRSGWLALVAATTAIAVLVGGGSSPPRKGGLKTFRTTSFWAGSPVDEAEIAVDRESGTVRTSASINGKRFPLMDITLRLDGKPAVGGTWRKLAEKTESGIRANPENPGASIRIPGPSAARAPSGHTWQYRIEVKVRPINVPGAHHPELAWSKIATFKWP
jgi:hypothetical protein